MQTLEVLIDFLGGTYVITYIFSKIFYDAFSKRLNLIFFVLHLMVYCVCLSFGTACKERRFSQSIQELLRAHLIGLLVPNWFLFGRFGPNLFRLALIITVITLVQLSFEQICEFNRFKLYLFEKIVGTFVMRTYVFEFIRVQ